MLPSNHPNGWDSRVSMMYLELNGLFQYTSETVFTPPLLAVCSDPRGTVDAFERQLMYIIHHNETMLLLDRFHHGANKVWLDVLHPFYGRCWIRGNYEYGLDPYSRVFLPV